MNTSIIPVTPHSHFSDKFAEIVFNVLSYMSALLLTGMTFHLWKHLLLFLLEMLYAILIEHRY